MPSDPDFIALFRNETNIATLKPGEALFSEGDPALCMYVVRSGTVRITSGKTMLEEIGPGSILGEMALIGDTPRSATVTAVTDCEIAVVDRRRFLFLVQQTPSFALNVMRVLSHRLREMNRRYRD
jgi:CRP/FNR family transcriptional regulator, cyclic AMP receptor protein